MDRLFEIEFLEKSGTGTRAGGLYFYRRNEVTA
jgi:hypothetical protein